MSQRKVSAQQRLDICAIYKSGSTQTAISKRFGVSKSLIQQILKANGVRSDEGGRAEAKRKTHYKKEREHIKKYGCTKTQLDSIREAKKQGSHDPLTLFKSQQRHAMRRGVEWNLKFWEWWTIWDESGRWNERGRGVGKFCMCRKGDSGAYEASNVYIASVVHNSTLGRTLSFERGIKKTFVYELINACGGPAAVARHIGVDKSYLSQLGVRDELPSSWLLDGKAEALATASGGAFSLEQIRDFKLHSGAY